jgi:hypothetical protein
MRRSETLRTAVAAGVVALVAIVSSGWQALAGATFTPDTTLDARLGGYGDAGTTAHWIAGDCSWSIRLPDGSGRIAWFFCDSLLGTVKADHSAGAGTQFVNNLALVERGSAFTTLSGTGTPASYFPSPASRDYYWVGNPVPTSSSTLQVPLYRRTLEQQTDDSVTGTGTYQLNYTGSGWTHGTDCAAFGIACYQNTESEDSTTGDHVSYQFPGTRVSLFGVKGPRFGIADVLVDGQSAGTADYYQSGYAGNQLVWTSQMLRPGTHTLELQVSGTKNASSSGVAIDVDRMDVPSYEKGAALASIPITSSGLGKPTIQDISSRAFVELGATTACGGSTSVAYGSAVVPSSDGHTYIYGTEDCASAVVSTKFLHLARVSGKNLTATWSYFTGSGWSSTPAAAARLLKSDGSQFNLASDEFSVVQTSGGYRVVESQDSIFQIAIYGLGAPQGPIPAGTVLPTSAEPEGGQPAPPRQSCSPCGTGTLMVYNAKEHPELETGSALVVSYNVNSTVGADIFLDVRNYRPRFLDVTLS